MRILRLEFENLNSLRGKHCVAFDQPPLSTSGIFCITGPTGAGKTTLLDAITLALYGRAARYGNAPNPETTMSRHTGNCRAEVSFSVKGNLFRAQWQLNRARGKPGGRVQPPKRFLYDASGTVLAEKIKDVDEQIIELTGLNYDRFMRSVLLAQGEFARLIKAKNDERAALLESLTATTIYSELSQLAHQHHSDLVEDVDRRVAELGYVEPLSGEARDEIEALSQTQKAERDRSRKQAETIQHRVNRADELASQLSQQAAFISDRERLRQERESLAPDLTRLATHRETEPFAETLTRHDQLVEQIEALGKERVTQESLRNSLEIEKRQVLCASRQTVRKLLKELETEQKKIGKLQSDAEGQKKDLSLWLDEHRADEKLNDELAGLISKLTSLASSREGQRAARKRNQEISAEINHVDGEIAEREGALQKSGTSLKAARAGLIEIEDAFENLSSRASIDDLRQQLLAIARLEQQESDLAERRQERQTAEQSLTRLQAELLPLRTLVTESTKSLKALEEIVRLRQQALLDAKLIASYEQARAELSKGRPCPLCGAVEHPWSDPDASIPGNREREEQLEAAIEDQRKSRETLAQKQSQVDRIEAEIQSYTDQLSRLSEAASRLEKESSRQRTSLEIKPDADLSDHKNATTSQISELEKLGQRRADAVEQSKALESEEKLLQAKLDDLKSHQSRLKAETGKLSKEIEVISTAVSELEGNLSESLSPYQESLTSPGAEAELQDRLSNRSREWRKQSEMLITAEKSLADLSHQQTSLEPKIQQAESSLKKLNERIPESRKDDPGTFSFEDTEAARAAFKDVESRFQEAVVTLQNLISQINKSSDEQSRLSSLLTEQLAKTSFGGIDSLRLARLPRAEREKLSASEETLKTNEQKNRGNLEACEAALKKLREAGTLEGEALVAERVKLTEAKEELDNAETALAETLAAIRQDDSTRLRQKALEKEIEASRKALRPWKLLADLIGSHDGKKFREFAQGLTLNVLISHANRHFRKLNPRYRLTRSASESLGLEIIDAYQADTQRPMSSLSGGETFLASLALALGLSDLAGRNVQIDSLFIDEGFGTLDAETLEIALAALESLRLQDKSVGIISHVELIKERIGTQIQIEPGNQGVSRIVIQ
ncbi:MAG: AAA family ATPase [Verrucomicrobiota bacterium]